MTTALVVKTSVIVNNNSPIQDYVHPDDDTQPTPPDKLINNTFTQLAECLQIATNLEGAT